MPAQTPSRIDPALGHLLAVVEPFADDRVGLAVCAVLAGARSYVAISEWASDADAPHLVRGRRRAGGAV